MGGMSSRASTLYALIRKQPRIYIPRQAGKLRTYTYSYALFMAYIHRYVTGDAALPLPQQGLLPSKLKH